MAKSKTDPSRKDNVNKFKQVQKEKNQQRMSNVNEIPDLPKINQRPYWNSQDDLTIKGFEFEAMVNVINIFREGVTAVESSLQRNVQSGKIKMKYFDENNVELTEAQVESVTAQYQAFFNATAAKRAEVAKEGEVAQKSLILDETGTPTSSEKVDEKPKLTAV